MKLLGFTEEITSCDCCGKSDLKGTYAFDNGVYYGSSCAQKVTNVSSDLLKIAKIKSEYNLVAFNQDSRIIELQNNITNAKTITERKELIKSLREIKEEYKK